MKAHITLDISDIDALVREAAAKLNLDLTGYTVMSHQREVIRVNDNMVHDEERFNHRIDPRKRQFPDMKV